MKNPNRNASWESKLLIRHSSFVLRYDLRRYRRQRRQARCAEKGKTGEASVRGELDVSGADLLSHQTWKVFRQKQRLPFFGPYHLLLGNQQFTGLRIDLKCQRCISIIRIEHRETGEIRSEERRVGKERRSR